MTKVPPPLRKGSPPPPEETVGNLDSGEAVRHLSFRVRSEFKKEFSVFAIQHDYPNQEAMLYEAFELLKERKRSETQ